MDVAPLLDELKRDEGVRLKPYRCTAGKLSIGVGRNLDDVGITESEAEYMLRTDVARSMSDLDRFFPWWRRMSEPRQRALCNMAFNMGIGTLAKFRKMLAALERGDYEDAAREALSSAWATQVGARSQRIAAMIREG